MICGVLFFQLLLLAPVRGGEVRAVRGSLAASRPLARVAREQALLFGVVAPLHAALGAGLGGTGHEAAGDDLRAGRNRQRT